MAKPTKIDDAAAPAPARPKPLQAAVTAAQLERCRRALDQKLARAIVNCPDDGDVGIISKAVADLRALDLIEPQRPNVPVDPAKPDDPDTAERKAAASDDAAMQRYNAKVARKESIDAERAEA